MTKTENTIKWSDGLKMRTRARKVGVRHVHTFGRNYGPNMRLMGETEHVWRVNIPGHRAWGGIGMQDYVAGSYVIFQITLRDGLDYWVEEILECNPGKFWRAAKEEGLEKIKQLEKEIGNG